MSDLTSAIGEQGHAMDSWTETWRGIVAPWECDITEHFTIAYYFDRLADAASITAASLGLDDKSVPAACRFDVRFARELRAGASFHILSAPLAFSDGALRLGHQFIDSADREVTTWVQETREIPAAAALPTATREAISRRLSPWPGPAVEPRPEASATEGFVPTARDRVKPADLGPDGNFALAAFVHRFTAGCVQALAAIGATAGYLHTERKGFSTFELTLQVSRLPRLGDAVVVETGIVHLGSSSIRFMHRMSDPADRSELARLGQFGVQLDLDTRRPAALPQALHAAAQRLLVPVA
jgi:acyl-CoA thioesterase FadM